MSETDKTSEIFTLADQFIEVANNLVTEQNKELGLVGAAIRYAAARFNAHEALYKSEDLAGEKKEALAWFTKQYELMLEENLDEHIQIEKSNKNDNI